MNQLIPLSNGARRKQDDLLLLQGNINAVAGSILEAARPYRPYGIIVSGLEPSVDAGIITFTEGYVYRPGWGGGLVFVPEQSLAYAGYTYVVVLTSGTAENRVKKDGISAAHWNTFEGTISTATLGSDSDSSRIAILDKNRLSNILPVSEWVTMTDSASIALLSTLPSRTITLASPAPGERINAPNICTYRITGDLVTISADFYVDISGTTSDVIFTMPDGMLIHPDQAIQHWGVKYESGEEPILWQLKPGSSNQIVVRTPFSSGAGIMRVGFQSLTFRKQ